MSNVAPRPSVVPPASASGSISSDAGSANRNASIHTPSIPATRPIGSSRRTSCSYTDIPPKLVFTESHITAPAGAATETARPRTNIVRSRRERTITRPTCGIRYGGSSSVNEDGVPRSTVEESRRETRNVMRRDRSSIPISAPVEARLPNPRQERSARSTGKRPLHGTREFVSIAIRRSRGESIMRQPVTPAALHPSPMSMVREISGVFFFVYTSNKAIIYPHLLYLMPFPIVIFFVISLLYLNTVNQLSKQRLC